MKPIIMKPLKEKQIDNIYYIICKIVIRKKIVIRENNYKRFQI